MYTTEQENFWASDFGNNYIDRNRGNDLLACNLFLFGQIFKSRHITSALEFGANIGLNLKALRLLFPNLNISGIEINKKAADIMKELGNIEVFNQSILDFVTDYKRDFVFTSGVLIHINPEKLPIVYEKLYQSSNKYIGIIEYYNPTPVMVNYRGEDNRLFKRDFAGEMLEKYKDLRLIDYGFVYRRDNVGYDDLNWFLLKKNNGTEK